MKDEHSHAEPGARSEQVAVSPRLSAAMSEKVALDDALKAQILELEVKLETADFFTLMGVPADAEAAVVKAEFYKLSRHLHPDRYFRKNLGSFRSRLEKVFRTLSKAHQTLTDPARREAYLEAHPGLRRGSVGTAARAAPAPQVGAREFDPLARTAAVAAKAAPPSVSAAPGPAPAAPVAPPNPAAPPSAAVPSAPRAAGMKRLAIRLTDLPPSLQKPDPKGEK